MVKPATMAVVVGLLGGGVTGCATPQLETPFGEIRLMTVAAQGVQIYECSAATAASTGAAPAWGFVAPEADLFNADGRRIGRHGAGPSWQHEDGSGFVGTVRSRVESNQPGSIPWLLLSARPQGPDGAFARVSSVQRVNTVGGQPPAEGCSADKLGTRIHMAYRADYVLFVPAAR